LVDFAGALTPPPTHAPDTVREQLRELHTRRAQLVAMRADELKCQEQPGLGKVAAASLRRTSAGLTREITKLEVAADQLVDQSPALHHFRAVLLTTQGVGALTATAATLPELGQVSRQRIASLAGLAPFVYHSGQYKGQAHIRGGRLAVRQALYMAALSAMRCNPSLKPFAQRLTARGKPCHVVITAVMRKLLRHLNADLHRHPFVPLKTTQ
jgi:transposase